MTDSQKSPVTFGKGDVEIITRELLYKGFFTLTLYRFRHKLFSGAMSNEITREVFKRRHAAALLPYDPRQDQVVLIEQVPIAAMDNSSTPWLLEIVAGMIEPGETVEQVARREAKEEAGIEVRRCKLTLSYLANPGAVSERLSIMVGEVDASTATGIHGLATENEDIKVHVVSREQAYRWVEEGVIENAASVIALQWLELHHHALKKAWTK